MKLYENKREISLYDALYKMKADQVPDHNFEFMISFDEVDRLYVFGKTWTKKNPSNWGKKGKHILDSPAVLSSIRV